MVNLADIRGKIQKVMEDSSPGLVTPGNDKTIWDEIGLGDTARFLGLDDNLNDIKLSPNQKEIAMSMTQLTMGFEFEICVRGARWYDEAAEVVKREVERKIGNRINIIC